MIRDLSLLLAKASPRLHPRPIALVALDSFEIPAGLEVIGTFREDEGLMLCVDQEAADAAKLPVGFKAAWITMMVESSLEAVGFTAAFATVLAERGIACNVVAGARHDHLFVPWERREEAMAALSRL